MGSDQDLNELKSTLNSYDSTEILSCWPKKKKYISIILNNFESYTFGRGCWSNIRFNKYCFPSLTGRKADEKQKSHLSFQLILSWIIKFQHQFSYFEVLTN